VNNAKRTRKEKTQKMDIEAAAEAAAESRILCQKRGC